MMVDDSSRLVYNDWFYIDCFHNPCQFSSTIDQLKFYAKRQCYCLSFGQNHSWMLFVMLVDTVDTDLQMLVRLNIIESRMVDMV
jgi:hypothetical protein